MAQAPAHQREAVLNQTNLFLLMRSRMRYVVVVISAASVLDCHENSNRLVAGAGTVAEKQRQKQLLSSLGALCAYRMVCRLPMAASCPSKAP